MHSSQLLFIPFHHEPPLSANNDFLFLSLTFKCSIVFFFFLHSFIFSFIIRLPWFWSSTIVLALYFRYFFFFCLACACACVYGWQYQPQRPINSVKFVCTKNFVELVVSVDSSILEIVLVSTVRFFFPSISYGSRERKSFLFIFMFELRRDKI